MARCEVLRSWKYLAPFRGCRGKRPRQACKLFVTSGFCVRLIGTRDNKSVPVDFEQEIPWFALKKRRPESDEELTARL